MAESPYKSAPLNWIYNRTHQTRYERQSPRLQVVGSTKALPTLSVSSELQQEAMKAISLPQYIQDWINDNGGVYGDQYSEVQLEAAYRTSVFLFAAMRRVGNLMSEVKIVGEKRQGDEWVRLPETDHLNRMFSEAGAQFMKHAFIYYATYGSVLIYKRKTKRAVYQAHRGHPITKYSEGAVAGFHLIPNAHWTMLENQYTNEIINFNLAVQDDVIGDRAILTPEEVVYWHDFDHRRLNWGVSMVSLAINNAVTNAAIARWAAHYFMSGAMPLLLVSVEGNNNSAPMTQTDINRYKQTVQEAWRGLFGKFSLRTLFTDRKLNVEQAGIKAEEVQAPELDRAALNNIASVFQIAPDLIIPPEGGSDNARHKYLMQDAYYSGVLPICRELATVMTEQLGLSDAGMRVVVDEDDIKALEADRADESATEISIFNAGVQTYGEVQERLKTEPIPELERWININGRFQSVERVLRDDKMPNDAIFQYAPTAWDGNILRLSEIRKIMFNLGMEPGMRDGFKYEIVPDPNAGPGAPFGGDTPPSLPPGGDDGGAGPETPENAPDASHEAKPETPPESDADKDIPADEIRHSDEFAPPNPGIDGSITGVVTELPVPEPVTDIVEIPVEPQPAYLSFDLADDTLVRVAAQRLQAMLGEESTVVEWSDPATWHITLVYAPDVDDDALSSVLGLLPQQYPRQALRASGLQTFETPDGLCIALAVERDDTLIALQSAVRVAFEAQQVPVSEYSMTENYIPHVTLGYARSDLYVPEFAYAAILEPKAVNVGRSGFEQISSIPIERPDIRPADVLDDAVLQTLLNDVTQRRRMLRDWLIAWDADDEQPAEMPGDLADLVRVALSGRDREAVFTAARNAVEKGLFDVDAGDDGNPVLKMMAKSEQDSAEAELDAWERSAGRNYQKAARRFVAKRLPLKIEQDIRTALAAASDAGGIKAVFESARAALAAETLTPETGEGELAEWLARLQDDDDLTDLLDFE